MTTFCWIALGLVCALLIGVIYCIAYYCVTKRDPFSQDKKDGNELPNEVNNEQHEKPYVDPVDRRPPKNDTNNSYSYILSREDVEKQNSYTYVNAPKDTPSVDSAYEPLPATPKKRAPRKKAEPKAEKPAE